MESPAELERYRRLIRQGIARIRRSRAMIEETRVLLASPLWRQLMAPTVERELSVLWLASPADPADDQWPPMPPPP